MFQPVLQSMTCIDYSSWELGESIFCNIVGTASIDWQKRLHF
jgi:hypothetical protein